MFNKYVGGSGESLFPSGYKLKTGSLAASNIAANIIPIALDVSMSVTSSGVGGSANGASTDNFGTIYATVRSSQNYNSVSYGSMSATVDVMSKNNYDFDKMAQITNISNATIVAWLEK